MGHKIKFSTIYICKVYVYGWGFMVFENCVGQLFFEVTHYPQKGNLIASVTQCNKTGLKKGLDFTVI